MKKNCFIVLGILLSMSCADDPQQESPSGSHSGFSESIQVDSRRSVHLTPEAQEEVSQWLAYATAQNEIEGMREATGIQIIGNSQPLVQIMESLESTIPDTLNVVPVQSRANVLLTKAKVLHQRSSKKDKEPQEIFEAANDLIVEFDNFKLQLNERFLKRPEDFELELDKEFEQSQEQQDSLGPIGNR